MNRAALGLFFLWIFATTFWWGFAFIQLPGPTPDWLLSARAVCFGQTITGLPNAEGWRVLIFPPLLMLVSFLAVYWTELQKSLRIFSVRPYGKAVLSSIIFIVICEFTWIGYFAFDRWPTGKNVEISRLDPLPKDYFQSNLPAVPFSLKDQNKQNFGQQDLLGKKTILTFAFANCHTVCPAIVENGLQTVKSRNEKDTQLVIITLDPWRDTPASLSHALATWDAVGHATLLSGEVNRVLSVLDQYEVPHERNKKTGSVTHPPLVYVLNKKGRIAYRFSNPSKRWLNDALNRI